LRLANTNAKNPWLDLGWQDTVQHQSLAGIFIGAKGGQLYEWRAITLFQHIPAGGENLWIPHLPALSKPFATLILSIDFFDKAISECRRWNSRRMTMNCS
jgi:hypothetical protein